MLGTSFFECTMFEFYLCYELRIKLHVFISVVQIKLYFLYYLSNKKRNGKLRSTFQNKWFEWPLSFETFISVLPGFDKALYCILYPYLKKKESYFSKMRKNKPPVSEVKIKRFLKKHRGGNSISFRNVGT